MHNHKTPQHPIITDNQGVQNKIFNNYIWKNAKFYKNVNFRLANLRNS